MSAIKNPHQTKGLSLSSQGKETTEKTQQSSFLLCGKKLKRYNDHVMTTSALM